MRPPLSIATDATFGSDAEVVARCLQIARVCSAGAAAIALVVTFGWVIGSPWLIRGGTHLNGMAPNTAVALLLAAIGLRASLLSQSQWHRRFAAGGALGATLIGLLTLAEYFLHRDFGIDQALFADTLRVLTAPAPGRMAMMTATLIAMLGVAIGVGTFSRSAHAAAASQSLAIAVLAASVGRVMAYVYESGSPGAPIFAQGMALHTTVAISLLSLALLCRDPARGWMSVISSSGPGGMLARRSFLLIAAIPFLAGTLRIAAERQGLLGTASAIAFMVVTWILTGAALKIWNARHLDRLEMRLLQERDQADRLFALSADMLCVAHADGYFKRVSPAIVTTLGWTPKEFTSRPFREFIHPDDVAATLAEVERQLRTGEPVLHFQNRYRHKNGSWRTLSWQSVPTPDGFMYGTARDVTEGQRREEAMRQIAKRLSLATEAAGIGIWEWNVRTGEIGWDERMFAIYGVPFGAPVDYELWKSRVHPEDFPDNDARLQRVVAEKGRGTRDFRIVLPSGEVRHIHADECVMLDASREVISVVGVNLDMTERVRGEIALEEARDQALAAARAKSDFLANMSHELRTPLNAIIGFTEMIQDGVVTPQDPEFREFLGDISRSSHHLLNLINDILDLAKVESGKMLFRPEAVDLPAIVGEVQSVGSPGTELEFAL